MSQFDFWIAVSQIIMIDILLGGDNAVVIALACRKLSPSLRTKGILVGTAGAVLLRAILVFFVVHLLEIPLLKLIGALLLLYIGVKLLLPEEDDPHAKLKESEKFIEAIKTIIIADVVMSLDNVIALAGAAAGAGTSSKMSLIIFGLVVSIPIIMWGSQLVARLMDRWPIIITIGGMLLGWIAGGLAITDPFIADFFAGQNGESQLFHYSASAIGACLVLVGAKLIGCLKGKSVGDSD